MTLTPPLDLLPIFPGWTTGFSLHWRQEQSTQASGRVLVKDMGTPLWTLRAQSKPLSPNNLDRWRARLTGLENGLVLFKAYPMSRCFPQAYPNGSWPTGGAFTGSGVLATVAGDRKTITVSGLPAGFDITVGDYLSVSGFLHQVMEGVTASGGGVTPAFEVRPHLNVTVSPGGAVSFKQPSCNMALTPGSLQSDAQLNGWGALSFEAMEARL
jgi:hypothetical protein